MYEADATVAEGIGWGFRFVSDVAFRWVPGTVQVLAGTAPESSTRLFSTPLTQPVRTEDVAYFLQNAAVPGAHDQLIYGWGVFVALSVFVSLLLAAGLIYSFIRLMQVRHVEEMRFLAASETVAAGDVPKTQLRWNRVLEHAHSENERDWRLAILEADIMLNELLDVLGYKGETMADKMKQVERGDFKTIDLAWEGHRIRNAIAHQGLMQELSSREVRRVIGMYEQVFREFRFIE